MASVSTVFSLGFRSPENPKKSICRHSTASKTRWRAPILRRSFTILCELKPGPSPSNPAGDDFVTRVLKENPSQVEPRYRVNGKLYNPKEREGLSKGGEARRGAFEFIKRKTEKEKSEDVNESVYLSDILREYKGKLYVPEQVFGQELSEEEEFEKSVKELPKMSLEDFRKAMENDKVKLLTSKEEASGVSYSGGYRDFIVDLKEIPGVKSLQRTKWSMRLGVGEAQALLKEYSGPQYEVESNMMTSWVGKVTDFPNPVASSISSRVMVELGMVTAVIAASAAVVGGFLASAVFAVTSFAFVTTVYVVWPIVKPFLKLFIGVFVGGIERSWEYIADVLADGGIFSRISDFYTFGGMSSSVEMLKPILLVVMTMVLLVRFTLSRRPKNFRKWDLWQGIAFSQSKAEARVDGSTGVKFGDVAGIDEAVDELQELVKYLKNPDLFDKMGIKPPHGVLLEGPPGCGKTLVAKAIAGEAGVPFYQMAGSEFVEVLVGVGSARIRDLFKRAKVNKPSVIFIDEIDALATRRQGIFKENSDQSYNAATQERETTLNQLLIELDGFDTGKGVIFLGATNRRDLLDPALLRPGRFDRKIRIRPPNAKGRLDILKIHASKVKMSDSVDLSSYASNLPGWSGAKLAQLVQEAALVAVRKTHSSILQSDMDDAVDRLTVGPTRIGLELGHEGQCRRAATEVGVAITSHLLLRYENAKIERCDRISIIPRGQTLSQVVFHRLDDESYMFGRRPQLLHRLQVLLGARAAEEVIYGSDTSKASVDYLSDASWLARKILTIWNLENPMVIHGEPPPWRKRAQFVGPRLDFEGSLYDDYDLVEPPINFNMDDEVAERSEELISQMYNKTVALLKQNQTALLKTVKVLLNQKEISGEAIDFILDNYPPETRLDSLLQEQNPGSLPFVPEHLRRESDEFVLVNHSTDANESATGKENNYCLLRKGQLQDVYEHVLSNNALLICKIVIPEGRGKHKTLDRVKDKSLIANGPGVPSQLSNATHYRLEPDGTGYNYASAMKGAKVVDQNKEAKGASNVLGKDHDKYLRNPCSVSNKYVVIELAEETLVDTVRVANFEHYSSNLKEFSLSGSLSYPTDTWTHAGRFVAANAKQVQTFRLQEPKWLRYLKLSLISHYGSEFYCTLSVVEVFGIDALEQMVEDLFVGSETLPSKPAMLELSHEEKTADEKQDGEVKSNATDQIGKETDGQKKKDVVVKTINIVGDKKYEVREKHNVLKLLMQKVKLIEMNLSVVEDSVKGMSDKETEVSLEMKRTLTLVERSKAEIKEITEWKEKMEKELRDLELWKTLVVSRVESLARGNNALRLDVEKIEREQANLESKELGVLLISLFLVFLATIRLLSRRLWAFLGMSFTDKMGSLWPDSGWVMILLSSSIMIFITLLS
uniref:SUN domain-containing protein n=1 Tax=Brassica campestris TaxID=3711 RepID=M4DB87_BRACM